MRVISLIPSWRQTDFNAAAGLDANTDDILSQCISPSDLGAMVVQVASLPEYLVIEETTLWPMIQPFNALARQVANTSQKRKSNRNSRLLKYRCHCDQGLDFNLTDVELDRNGWREQNVHTQAHHQRLNQYLNP